MRNNNNQHAFYALLRAGLWADSEKQVSLGGPVDWEDVYRQASEQAVLGLVLDGIDCLPYDQRPPKVLLQQWIGEILMLERQNKEMNYFISELVDKMQKDGIYAILVKGQGVALYYDRPYWRTCGDIDLLLNKENYEKAKALLLPLSSSSENEATEVLHLGMTIDSWVVELHGSLRSCCLPKMDKVIDMVVEDIFSCGNVRSWTIGNVPVLLPSPNNDVFIVFTHIIKHFFHKGIGLRQICDWCRLLWSFNETIDKVLLEKRLRKAGLLTEWNTFAAFAVEYLGMPVRAIPLYIPNDKWKRKACRINKIVLGTGNFGHNRDNDYYTTKLYLIRKIISLWRHTTDGTRQFSVFPLDSIEAYLNQVALGLKYVIMGN